MNTLKKLFGLTQPENQKFRKSSLRGAWDELMASSLETSGKMASLWDLDISFPLYAEYGSLIISQFIESLYKHVGQYLLGRYANKGYFFPSRVQLRINKSDDFPVRGQMMEQLKLRPSYPMNVKVDTKEGTVVSPSDLPRGFQGEVLDKMPRQVHINALTDTLFEVVFVELEERSDKRTDRILTVENCRGGDPRAAVVSGSLRLHRENILCGRNAGSRYEGEANIIRLNDDTMPSDFARISVTGTTVKIEWKDNSVVGCLDTARLRADGREVTFPLSSRLRIGNGLYGTVTFLLD